MHAADVVRRDAVEQRVWFESEYAQNETDVIVTLYRDDQQTNIGLIYTVDNARQS